MLRQTIAIVTSLSPPSHRNSRERETKVQRTPGEDDFFQTLNDARNGLSKPLRQQAFYEPAEENFNPWRGAQGRSSKGYSSKARRKENRAPLASTSEWERVEVDGVSVGKNQLNITFSNGRVLSSKEAHKIPELSVKLLEKYEGTILAFTQTLSLISQK